MTFIATIRNVVTKFPRTAILTAVILDCSIFAGAGMLYNRYDMQDKVVATFPVDKVPTDQDSAWACSLHPQTQQMECADYGRITTEILRRSGETL